MAINFDSLPTTGSSNSNQLIEKGTYFAVVEKAEMKTPKKKADGTQGPDYLNLMLKVSDNQGKGKGNVWDIISESNSNYVQYKLRRFIMALGIEITPGLVLELKDLVKIAPGTKLLVDISIDEKSTPNKNQVDIFSGDVYYHISEANTVFGDSNFFVDASDAEDVFPTDEQGIGKVEY